MEERIVDLERRINALEMMVGVPDKASDTTTTDTELEKVYAKPTANIEQGQDVTQSTPYRGPIKANVRQMTNTVPKQGSSKLNEAAFGKYIIGALASLLVFVAAISLIALVWDTMSGQVKLLLLVLIGLVLTIIGFMRVKKHKNAITAIILGTGSGLLFISILAAHMAFNLISSTSAFMLAGIWALFFILSYKYTQTFFTTIISYIGSFIAMVMGLTLVKGNIDYIVVVVFTVSVGLAMLVSGYKWLKPTKQLIATLLTLVSIMSILVYGSVDINYILTNWVYYFAVLILLMYGLVNRIYYLLEKLNVKVVHVFIGALAAILTIIGLVGIDSDLTPAIVIFIIIMLAQILLNEWKDYSLTTSLTLACSLFLIGAVMILNIDLFGIPLGVTLVAVVLLLIDQYKGESKYKLFVGLIVLFESMLILLINTVDDITHLWAYTAYTFIPLVVISYLLHQQYRLKNTNQIITLKSIGLIAYIVNIYFLVTNAITYFSSTKEGLIGPVLGYLCITIVLVLLINSGYFKNWKDPNFKWFSKNLGIQQDQSIGVLYCVTTIVYFLGLVGISLVQIGYEQFIMIATVLCIALLQSVNLLKYKKAIKVMGIWIGLKYYVLTCVILDVTFDVSFDSVIYSLAGLVLAILCIAIGFKVKVKSLRLYGLILTIFMVLKFIVVDLSQENSVTRVVALMLGGLICFGISVLYNKLNSIIEGSR